MGALSEPSLPALAGRERFAGPLFHSAAWRHDVELRGARVAVIGTGASAIQIVPELQPLVRELTVYQRSPPWILPHPDRPISDRERALYRAAPIAQHAMRSAIAAAREALVFGFRHPRLGVPGERLARAHLERQVTDARMREALQPAYRLGCKRILISNRYYPALGRPNVTLVPHAVTEIRPRSVLAADGVERLGRRDRRRHRLQRHRLRGLASDPGARRSHAGGALERASRGLQGHDDRRIPQPLHAARTPHRVSATPRSC